MPKVSLVVCLRNETAFLKRLLQNCSSCYDDLVVVHDGWEDTQLHPNSPISKEFKDAADDPGLKKPGAPPWEISLDYSKLKKNASDPTGYRPISGAIPRSGLSKLVERHHGRLYVGPRCFQQEPHWPFAWWKARHDWILRLDADEYPSKEMRVWLRGFRKTAFALKNISGFSCLWPFWDGREEFFFTQMEWRPFLFHKQRVSFVGMAEQGPIPAFKWKSTGLTLHHRPHRSSFGLNYVLFRRQSYRWRKCIAASLMRRPIDLPCWHYSRETWPIHWAQIIQKPWSVGLRRFIRILAVNLGSMPKKGFKFFQSELFGAPFHQLLISWTYGFCRLKSGQGYDAHPSANHRV
jgi:hypothetical protein